MKKISLIIGLIILAFGAIAQAEYESYWQQRTHYTIDATINADTDILTGHEQLVYYNNSPHKLGKLYFHLYQNAFQPGSYLDNKQKNYNNPIWGMGRYESEGKGIEVSNVTVNGKKVSTTKDNTILEVALNNSIKPGDSAIIEMDFNTYFDIEAGWRRMRVYETYGVKSYNGGHWYPRISVFDRKFGWTADQHMVHEFYGDFGTYDIKLTFPKHYILDATGILQNEKEVLPDELKEKLDITNFKNKPLYSEPSEIIEPTSETKTWHFHAKNVHDFAFVASPLFRIGEVEWNGITCRALAMEPHAARWQDAARLAADIIQIFSEDFGRYAYPKIIVADVQSGMEYPMLTMNSGMSPGYADIFSHEIAHNWFFAAVGTNETYRAALDEGFTQFLNSYALEKLQKSRPVRYPKTSSFPGNKKKQHSISYSEVFKGYYDDAFYHEGTRLNQHSDKFDTGELYGRVYRQTYYKSASMLKNLQFVLGDSLFRSSVKHYYKTWKFRHPYLEDMRNAFINHSGVELNWFFDQWLNTKKTIDYGVASVKNKKDSTQITLERHGRMEMPLDVLVIRKNGDSTLYHIPNRKFVKATEAKVLDKWFGWDKLNPEYTFTVQGKSKVKDVIIDPGREISDMNRLNNTRKCNLSTDIDYLVTQPEIPWYYDSYIRPDIWWNERDGLKAGIHLDGSYMKELHKFSLSAFYNTQLLTEEENSSFPVSWQFSYKTRLNKAPNKSELRVASIYDAGWSFNKVAFRQHLGKGKANLNLSINSSYMNADRELHHSVQADHWRSNSTGNPYIYFRAAFNQELQNSHINAGLTSGLGRINQSKVDFTIHHELSLGKILLRSRGFAQYGLSGHYPAEDALLLSGANPLEQMQNRIVRSEGIIPGDWQTYGNTPNHFHYGGGLNIRGYSGYYSPVKNENGEIEYLHNGNTGVSVNMELSTARLFQPVPKSLRKYLNLDIYSFFDAGALDEASITKLPDFERIYFDAGLGVNLNIQQWWKFDKIDPLTLRFDMPLFLNVKPYGDANNFMFRWLFGIEKSF
ncbi:MAG: M1 family metallopeptidase [Bacteroidales bacterium]|nr:M1 family metallopeptidase [Bacteroidales bacterium]MCF8327702.1 M1 family metallopeptidase [Bacteroidales bacterium]